MFDCNVEYDDFETAVDETAEVDEITETAEVCRNDFDDLLSHTEDITESIVETTETSETLSPAELAAEYVRSFEGFEKAADYVERHFEGDEYNYGDVIKISTRNQALEGDDTLEGVVFNRREVELADDLVLEGVFPEFEHIHHVDLGEAAKDMSLHQQLKACKEHYQHHLFDNRDALKDITLGDMMKMEDSQGYAPEGWTWNHDPDIGQFDLVKTSLHSSVGHTGGNSFWTKISD